MAPGNYGKTEVSTDNVGQGQATLCYVLCINNPGVDLYELKTMPSFLISQLAQIDASFGEISFASGIPKKNAPATSV